MDTIKLEMPQKSDLDYWRELTNWNNHTLARREIAEWLVRQFHAQGAIVPYRNGKPFVDIEIDREHWTVRQCYAKCNQTPKEEISAFAKFICDKAEAIYRKAA